jgi:peroxiredoxin
MGRVQIGEAAPDFEATAHDGTFLSLSALAAEGPVVLSLLRGFS